MWKVFKRLHRLDIGKKNEYRPMPVHCISNEILCYTLPNMKKENFFKILDSHFHILYYKGKKKSWISGDVCFRMCLLTMNFLVRWKIHFCEKCNFSKKHLKERDVFQFIEWVKFICSGSAQRFFHLLPRNSYNIYRI